MVMAAEFREERVTMIPAHEFFYSEVYSDTRYDYRHVITPEEYQHKVPTGRLLSEMEWRTLGIQMSPGWVHYMLHDPEPHIFLFRRIRRVNEDNRLKD